MLMVNWSKNQSETKEGPVSVVLKDNLSAAGYCVEQEPPNMAEYLIRQGIVLGLPVLITLTTILISLPSLCRCVSNTSFSLRSQAEKEDLGLLRNLFLTVRLKFL